LSVKYDNQFYAVYAGLMGSFGLTSQKYVSPQYVSSLPAECTVYDFSLSKYTL